MIYILFYFIEGLLLYYWIKEYYIIGIRIYNKCSNKNKPVEVIYNTILQMQQDSELEKLIYHISKVNNYILFRSKFTPHRIPTIHGVLYIKSNKLLITGYSGLTDIILLLLLPITYFINTNLFIIILFPVIIILVYKILLLYSYRRLVKNIFRDL